VIVYRGTQRLEQHGVRGVKVAAMTDDDRLEILAEAQKRGLYGFHGECGEVALAINELLFDGEAEIVAAVNVPLYRREDRLVGHVGVRPFGFGDDIRIWDAEGVYEGEEGYDEFMAKGMLDPEDPDYEFENPEEAFDAEIITLTEEEVRRQLPWCGPYDPRKVLRAAKRKIL
jgi:hypothetical protein